MNALHIITLALIPCLPLRAQGGDGCPHQKTRDIPASFVVGPSVRCDVGVSMVVGGVPITTGSTSCPTSVVITPTHQEIVKSDLETRVEPNGNAPELAAFYQCTAHYLLLIRLSDTCDLQQVQTLGAVPLLRTVPCSPAIRL